MHRPMESIVRQGSGKAGAGPLIERIRSALERKDLAALAELYAEDATVEEVSSLDAPSHPAAARGREGILGRLREQILRDPISGWSRQLESWVILDAIETEDAIAFTELRTYAAGDKVIAQHIARKHNGRIERDRVVVAWDAD
jgi:ketosteroid isomerase-like protein